MIVLGLILIVLALVVGSGVIAGATAKTSFDVFGVHISNIAESVIFIAGAVTLLVLIVGLWLVTAAAGRKRRLRAERRERERGMLDEHERLTGEKAELEARLEREQAARETAREAARPPREDDQGTVVMDRPVRPDDRPLT
jgi:hypothetical protein